MSKYKHKRLQDFEDNFEHKEWWGMIFVNQFGVEIDKNDRFERENEWERKWLLVREGINLPNGEKVNSLLFKKPESSLPNCTNRLTNLYPESQKLKTVYRFP